MASTFDQQMHPRASKISSLLSRFYAEHKHRVTLSSFVNYMKPCTTISEAKELFEYYVNEESCMKQSLTSTRVYSFICRQDHFNMVAVSEVIKKLNFKTQPKQVDPKPSVPTVITKTVEKPVIVQSEPVEKIVYKEKDYSNFSLEELDAELARIKKIREQKDEAAKEQKRIRTEYNLKLTDLERYCRKLGCGRNQLQSVLDKIVRIKLEVDRTERDFPFVKNPI